MTLDQTLDAINKLRHDAREIAAALHKHAVAVREPALHGKLHRLHSVVRDFCFAMPSGAA